jgi:S-adenosylmethionine hydrolase
MSKLHPVAALLTDFGLRDHYVGVMKGVLLSICPTIQIIDITHEVEPQNVQQAAYLLWASYRFLPKGTIVVCVVDPGVGSPRQIIAAKTARSVFLAPQNGSLDIVLWQEQVKEVTVIQPDLRKSKSVQPNVISSTFHGRDVFAPLCATLAQGTRLSSLGRRTRVDWVKSPFVDEMNPLTRARVLHIDRFGNIVTNIVASPRNRHPNIQGIRMETKTVERWIENYSAAPPDEACLIVGSSNLIEIVMPNRSAAAYLRVDQSTPLNIVGR